MKASQILNNIRHLNTLKKFVGFEVFTHAVNSQLSFGVVKDIGNQRALVLAPHPDDDILGCGGAMKLIAQNGGQVRIVYLTDGSLGFNDNKRRALRERIELAKKRENEAKKAALSLGVKDLVFWRYKDGGLVLNKTNLRLLCEMIDDYKPEIIFAPSFLDNNPDHIETSKILAEALRSNSKTNPSIYSYEIWSPVYANKLIVIDQVAKDKFLALKMHESQLKARNYLNAIRGLNRYRAGMYSVGEYAEGFFVCNKNLYLKLFDIVNLK